MREGLRLPQPSLWTEVDLGQNTFADVPGSVLAETDEGRRELMVLEAGDESRQVLLTMDVYDAEGRDVAKLQRNVLVSGEEAFAVTASASSVTLSEKGTGRTVVEAIALDRGRVQVLQGNLFTPSGDRLAIRPDRLIFQVNTFAGHHLEGQGQDLAIVVGPSGFSLSPARQTHPSWQEESSAMFTRCRAVAPSHSREHANVPS